MSQHGVLVMRFLETSIQTRVSRHKDGQAPKEPLGIQTLHKSQQCDGQRFTNVFPPPARSKQTTPKAAHDSREGQDPITPWSPGPCQAASLALPCTRTKCPLHPSTAPPDHPGCGITQPEGRRGLAGCQHKDTAARVPGTGHGDDPA